MTRLSRSTLAMTLAALLGSVPGPARAERIETYWRLEPKGPERPTSATRGVPFFEQRLLPVRLVRLTEPVTIGDRTLSAGTLLYLVFNADGRIGYCTIKDRSAANQARTLFIPMLDRRPCLADSDGDGRFDRTFSVFDKYGGPPSVRGSINDAQPLGASPRFEQVDVHEFPLDMRLSIEFRGSRTNPANARVRVSFTGPVAGVWQDVNGVNAAGGTLFNLPGVRLLLRAMTDGEATFELQPTPEIHLSSDNRNTLYWNPLPAFVAGQ